MQLVNIGFGNMVSVERIVTIVSPESAPIKRIIQDARDKGILIDATHGRKTRAVIFTDSGHIILTYLQTETVSSKISNFDTLSEEGFDGE
ncbi:MAG: DUF370 domain-containing protein [bacterium]|nr:DUF370 domain-containing protein [bacterium]